VYAATTSAASYQTCAFVCVCVCVLVWKKSVCIHIYIYVYIYIYIYIWSRGVYAATTNRRFGGAMISRLIIKYSSLLQNIVSFIGLFCKRDLCFLGSLLIVGTSYLRIRVQKAPLSTQKACCSVLQCAAVCCRVLQCVAVCCSVRRDPYQHRKRASMCCSVLQCVAVCCSVL